MDINHDFAKALVSLFNKDMAEYTEDIDPKRIPDSPYILRMPLELDWNLARVLHDIVADTGGEELVDGLRQDMGEGVMRLIKTGFAAGWLSAQFPRLGEEDQRSTFPKLLDILCQERAHTHHGCGFPASRAEFTPHWEEKKRPCFGDP